MANDLLDITWGVYNDYTIRDVHLKMQPAVLDYVMSHLYTSKVMQLLQIESDSAVVDDMKLVFQNLLENESSVVVLDKENVIKGVGINSCMTKKWKSWTAIKLLNSSPKMTELLNIILTAIKNYNNHNPDEQLTDTLHIFYYKFEPELNENFCFKKRFLNAICEVGRHMKLPYVSNLSFINLDREFLDKTDFKETSRIIYSMYVHNGRRPFDKLRDMDEMYASLYIKKLEPLIHYDDFIIRHPHLIIRDVKRKQDRRSVISLKPPAPEPEAPPDDDE